LIDIFQLIFKGDEKGVVEAYRKLYDQGVEPKVFISDFLELLYYFKNIHSLNLESTNFSLNDDEFSKIKELSKNIDSKILILFWQFAIKTLEELDVVSNQNISIEMFLVRLMYLNSLEPKNYNQENSETLDLAHQKIKKEELSDFKTDTINQIKNVTQEKKVKDEIRKEIKVEGKFSINSFEDLIKICSEKKEIKLKYELEKNVNLVQFEKNRIEISFNENLNKNFVKDLSLKLFEWTNQRWIIAFSKIKGDISIKEREKNKKIELLNQTKNSKLFKTVKEKFPDANLVDVILKKEQD